MEDSNKIRQALNIGMRSQRLDGTDFKKGKKNKLKAKKYGSKANLSEEEKNGYVEKDTVGEKKTNIRCSPLNFRRKLDEIPRKTLNILKDSPFECLLQLKGDVQCRNVVKQLALDFNCTQTKLCLRNGEYPLGEDDFCAIMGIKSGKDDAMIQVSEVDSDLSTKFCWDSRNDDSVSMEKVMKILTKGKDETAIKQAFVLLALRYIICPPAGAKLPKWYLQYVKDINCLNTKPWATLAMNALRKGIQNYQKGKGKERNLGGCLLFLQLYCMNGYKTIRNGRSIILDVDARMTLKFFKNFEKDNGFAHEGNSFGNLEENKMDDNSDTNEATASKDTQSAHRASEADFSEKLQQEEASSNESNSDLADFRHADGLSVYQIIHPIHDRMNTEHKRKLKEEFGIEPRTFKQELGDAVFIPAASLKPKIKDSDRLMQIEMPEKNTNTTEDSHGTLELWRGIAVGREAKELLETVEQCYPNTFQKVQIRVKPIWLAILDDFHATIKRFIETPVDALTKEQISSLEQDLKELEGLNFNLSWAHERLEMVNRLKFGNEPLHKELMALEESLARLKETEDKRLKELMEANYVYKRANYMYKRARLESDNGRDARNKKAQEMAQMFGAEYDQVLKGHLGCGMLPQHT